MVSSIQLSSNSETETGILVVNVKICNPWEAQSTKPRASVLSKDTSQFPQLEVLTCSNSLEKPFYAHDSHNFPYALLATPRAVDRDPTMYSSAENNVIFWGILPLFFFFLV